jgi:hypothetical protein
MSLLPYFARIHSRNLRVFFTPHTYTGALLRRSPGLTALCTWVMEELMPMGSTLSGPDVTVCTGRYAPSSSFHRSSGYRRSAGTLRCGLGRPTWLLWRGRVIVQVSASGAHREVLPSGGLGHGGSSAGRLLVPPSFTLLRGRYFSGEWCRGIHPTSRSFNRSPGHYSGVRRANLSVAKLPAAGRGLFARGGGMFNHRALGGASLCLCRQRRGPGSGQWSEGRATSGRFYETARVELVQFVGFALAGGGSGGLLVNRRLPPNGAGLAPTRLASGSFDRHFSLGGSLGFCPLLFGDDGRFSCRKTSWDSSTIWAFRKASSSSPLIRSVVDSMQMNNY